jgi:hypothetical protein
MEASWQEVAYVARYGHQPLEQILRLSRRELRQFKEALNSIVERENKPKP